MKTVSSSVADWWTGWVWKGRGTVSILDMGFLWPLVFTVRKESVAIKPRKDIF